MLEPEVAYVPNDVHDNHRYRVTDPLGTPLVDLVHPGRVRRFRPLSDPDLLRRVERERAGYRAKVGRALDAMAAESGYPWRNQDTFAVPVRGPFECAHGGHVDACAEGAHEQ